MPTKSKSSPLIVPLDPDGTASLTEHGRPVEAYLARLSQAGIGPRAELGVHRVARPCRGDLDPFRHVRHLAVQQQPHRGRQGAVGRAAEPAVRAHLHRRVPEYRGGLVVVPHVERLGQAAQPAPVGRLQEHHRPRVLGIRWAEWCPTSSRSRRPTETDPSCGRDRRGRRPYGAPGRRCAAIPSARSLGTNSQLIRPSPSGWLLTTNGRLAEVKCSSPRMSLLGQVDRHAVAVGSARSSGCRRSVSSPRSAETSSAAPSNRSMAPVQRSSWAITITRGASRS